MSVGGSNGRFELNVFLPMIIRNVLQSTQLCFLKRAFAEVNKEFGLDANVADNIMKAADEV